MSAPAGVLRGLPWDNLEPSPWWDEDNDFLYHTEPTDIRTAQFARVTYLCDDRNDKVATIWHDPHQPGRRGEGWIQVQFANETLWTGRWSTTYSMFRALGCEYKSISRVDLCCDGLPGEGGDWAKVMNMERTGKARYYGKCETLTRRSRGTITGGEFGTRRSNKFIRAYNKTREMKKQGVKPHIVAAWAEILGFDAFADGRDVHRFEAQLKGKEIRRYFPDEPNESFVRSLADQTKRTLVFSSMAEGMFDYRTQARRSRDAVSVVAWDWSRVTRGEVLKVPRAKKNIGLSDHTIKTGITAMAKLGIKTSDPTTLDIARRYAMAAGPRFLSWYESRLIVWCKQLAAIARARDERAAEVFYAFNNPEELLTAAQWKVRHTFDNALQTFNESPDND